MFINSHSHALDSSNLFAFPARVEPICSGGGWVVVGGSGGGGGVGALTFLAKFT